MRIASILRVSIIIILLVTGSAKVISSFGSAGILEALDPIFGLRFRTLFWCVGVCEIVIALICSPTNISPNKAKLAHI